MLGSPRRSKHLHGVLNFLLQVVVLVFEFAGKVAVVPSETECGQIRQTLFHRIQCPFDVHRNLLAVESTFSCPLPCAEFFRLRVSVPLWQFGRHDLTLS